MGLSAAVTAGPPRRAGPGRVGPPPAPRAPPPHPGAGLPRCVPGGLWASEARGLGPGITLLRSSGAPPPPEAGPRSQGGEAGWPPRSPLPAAGPRGPRPAHTRPPRRCQLPSSQTPLRSLPEGLFLEEAPTQKERGPEPSRRPGGRRRPAVTSLVPARHARAHILGDRNKHGCEIKNERESNLINRP